jgi:hypothetical protein
MRRGLRIAELSHCVVKETGISESGEETSAFDLSQMMKDASRDFALLRNEISSLEEKGVVA